MSKTSFSSQIDRLIRLGNSANVILPQEDIDLYLASKTNNLDLSCAKLALIENGLATCRRLSVFPEEWHK